MINANETLKQLGGNKFIAMTGAKDFIKSDNSIGFKIGRNNKNVNFIKITLNSMDTYDIEFINIRKFKSSIKSEARGIYWDMLQEIFTQHTGLHTCL